MGTSTKFVLENFKIVGDIDLRKHLYALKLRHPAQHTKWRGLISTGARPLDLRTEPLHAARAYSLRHPVKGAAHPFGTAPKSAPPLTGPRLRKIAPA